MNRLQRIAVVVASALLVGSAPAPAGAYDMWNGWSSWWSWSYVGAQFTPTTNLVATHVVSIFGGRREALAQSVTITWSGYIERVDVLLSTRSGYTAQPGDLELVIGSPSGHFSGSLQGSYTGRALNQEYVPFVISGIAGQRRWVNAGESITIELKNRDPLYNANYLWWGQSTNAYAGGVAMWWLQTDPIAGTYYPNAANDFAFRVHVK